MSEQPLTKVELARLLRAFAHLLESTDEPPPAKRRPRRPRVRDNAEPANENAHEKAVAALRRIGVLP